MTRDPQTIDLFVGSAEIVRCPAPTRHGQSNPCTGWFGPGPEGAHCADCRYLERHGHGDREVRWNKCGLRQNTGGPGSDHLVNWPACARFEIDE